MLQSREKELQKIYRYKGFIENMFFRPNLEIHTKRVAFLAEHICSILEEKGVKPDREYIMALAYMHDDDEFITGDFVSGDKLNFTPKQQKKYEKDCKNAINILVENYGEVFMWQSYRKLLEDNNAGASLEYKIVDLADKLDAHCEVCHELFNGNKEFFKQDILPWYGEVPAYSFTYIRSRERVLRIEKTLRIEVPILSQEVSSNDIFGSSIVKTLEDLQNISTAYDIYDLWIALQLEHFSNEDFSKLYVRSNGSVS